MVSLYLFFNILFTATIYNMTSDGFTTTIGSIATTIEDHNHSSCALKQSSIHKEFEEGIAHQTCDAKFFTWNSKVNFTLIQNPCIYSTKQG